MRIFNTPMQAEDNDLPLIQLYTHDVENYVFLIYQSGKMIMDESKMIGTAVPIKTIDQLFQLNIRIYYDGYTVIGVRSELCKSK